MPQLRSHAALESQGQCEHRFAKQQYKIRRLLQVHKFTFLRVIKEIGTIQFRLCGCLKKTAWDTSSLCWDIDKMPIPSMLQNMFSLAQLNLAKLRQNVFTSLCISKGYGLAPCIILSSSYFSKSDKNLKQILVNFLSKCSTV